MVENKLLRDTARQTVIDKNATLGDGARAAGDYDNSTELDAWCDAYLQVQYDTTAPAAGDAVAELYVLFGDGEGTEVFPNGGDGTVGDDKDPPAALLVGVFASVAPSLAVNEVVQIKDINLAGDGNRFVLKNVSGQTFDSTWELRIKPSKTQSV